MGHTALLSGRTLTLSELQSRNRIRSIVAVEYAQSSGQQQRSADRGTEADGRALRTTNICRHTKHRWNSLQNSTDYRPFVSTFEAVSVVSPLGEHMRSPRMRLLEAYLPAKQRDECGHAFDSWEMLYEQVSTSPVTRVHRREGRKKAPLLEKTSFPR